MIDFSAPKNFYYGDGLVFHVKYGPIKADVTATVEDSGIVALDTA